ncbi:hypothetical protein SKAU_G00008840 [Synaphobranchus kaupii]|uniref:Uncharacterized protein n=1 Tax=Synaphobranchus kaupii TaxID=118154 RepID=A0A9Q1GAU9_SYNKA|nr:hypothetical protein SKAU_G00008840 [Synaphobranchus kaupii]
MDWVVAHGRRAGVSGRPGSTETVPRSTSPFQAVPWAICQSQVEKAQRARSYNPAAEAGSQRGTGSAAGGRDTAVPPTGPGDASAPGSKVPGPRGDGWISAADRALHAAINHTVTPGRASQRWRPVVMSAAHYHI